ncbi:hypothetical protein [Endozoicomonas atrinae]|uniref:hypothetical protein n=1 Tax=Endozoicomonas atrinae TaxID=1333660 RepID=UPI000824EDEC|nr:hypothetical protein [Endozoicomonas atrinae]
MPGLAEGHEKKLHVVFATSEPETAGKMVSSILEHLPDYEVSVAALLIGQTDSQGLDKFPHPVSCISCHRDYLPIMDSRNRCQAYLQRVMRKEGGIGLVMDDDLKWLLKQEQFTDLCDQLIANGCDMAFCSLAGDAPIPKEYTRAAPLLDVMLAISSGKNDETPSELVKFTDCITTVNGSSGEMASHHDYYSYNKKNFRPADVCLNKVNWEDFLKKLFIGKATTRKTITPQAVHLASGRERGGATLIFNPSVLDFPNRAFSYHNIVSRRSDMIMAASAKAAGYTLHCTPPVLAHHRHESFDSHDSRKLIGDILGYALIESFKAEKFVIEDFHGAMVKRFQVTKDILLDTSYMLVFLHDWLRLNSTLSIESKTIIDQMVDENYQTIRAIEEVDFTEILAAYNRFVEVTAPQKSLDIYASAVTSVMTAWPQTA